MRLSNEGVCASALCRGGKAAFLFSMLTLCFLKGSAFADTPPTIATPATAIPATVTAKTTALSVLGADDLGATKLVYTWSLPRP